MPIEEEKFEHESFGMVGVYHTSGSPGPLFGSSIDHRHYVTIRIMTASRRRGLHQNWYSGDKQLIEIALSPTQYADMISAPNTGYGVPCTLQYVGDKRMEKCPEYNQRAIFEKEFEADVKKVMKDAKDLAAQVEAMITQKTVTKTVLKEVAGKLRMLMQHIYSNLPFVQSQFNEAMDNTVTEAKGEVEAFVTNKVLSLGIEKLTEMIEGGLVSLPTPDHPQLENKNAGE
jgi:hypothetical protein